MILNYIENEINKFEPLENCNIPFYDHLIIFQCQCLREACIVGDLDAASYLIENGVQPSEKVWNFESEFYAATFHGHTKIIEMLINFAFGSGRRYF